MSKASAAPWRVRVGRNIYRRPSGTLEIGFGDGAGIQRWRTVEGGILGARKLRDELLARRGRGRRSLRTLDSDSVVPLRSGWPVQRAHVERRSDRRHR